MTSWYAPVARAIPALVLAGVVTFSADHSSSLGLTVFGFFALAAGAVVTAAAVRSERGIPRTLFFVQGVLTVLAGVASLVMTGGGQSFFVLVLSAWATVTGFIELYLGLRERKVHRAARDWIFVGALTVVLAVVVLVVPPDYLQTFTVDGVERQLTASVIVVGTLGAYWAILGVYLVIAGLSLKWATDAPPASKA